jgi:hypothetical protein
MKNKQRRSNINGRNKKKRMTIERKINKNNISGRN